ncbi:MAG: hypothetical protein AABX89_05090 [Candidatus Thermoplasmatota archaeon]
MRILAAMMPLVFLAGCSGGLASFTPDGCDPSGATAINQDAPILSIFAIDLQLAKAAAQGAGETWLDDTPKRQSEGETEWGTAHGTITVYNGDDGKAVELVSTRAASFRKQALEGIAQQLGVAESGTYSEHTQTRQSWMSWGWPQQRHDGSIAAVAPSPSGLPGYIGLRAFHNLKEAHVEIDAGRAAEVAQGFARCSLDREGKTEAKGYSFESFLGEPRFDVFGSSLVFKVGVEFTEPVASHCGLLRLVAVDAVTGAVVGEPIAYCD